MNTRFLIQTINNQVKHDFSFTLLESIAYQNWLRNDKSFEYYFTEESTFKGCIPIGSVEFVIKYLQDHHGLTPKPKNIPEELMSNIYTGRNVINGTEKDIIKLSSDTNKLLSNTNKLSSNLAEKKFVKSNDKIKGFTEICETAPEGNYQISDVVEIESEWRVFVYQGKMVGLQNYSGGFLHFPTISKINKIIDAYKSAPIAHTLDVGIVCGYTVVIEVHDFFSCGLYGFSNHKILPFMFTRWFNEFIDNNKSINK